MLWSRSAACPNGKANKRLNKPTPKKTGRQHQPGH